MLHEVLLALIGVTGDVVTMSKDRRSFCVSSDIDFLDASEIALVQRLCRTGVEFRLLQQRVDWLRRLCTKAGVPTDSVEDMDEDAGVLMEDDVFAAANVVSGAASRQASLPHAGLYLYAFTQGVDVVLDGFRELVVAVETDALQHASVAYPLAKVHDAIAHYERVWPVCLQLTEQILHQSHRFGGAAIIDLLHDGLAQHTGPCAEVIQLIYVRCHQVLWHQLSSWILHGQLIDPFDEFLIQRSAISIQTSRAASVGVSLGDARFSADTSARRTDWSFEFSLRLPHVPLSLISFEAAHSILFTGKAMRVLQETQSADIYESRVAAASHDFTPIPPQDAVSIAELLQCLRDKPFAETLLIHQVLQQIQQCVAAHLWTLIVSQADLPAYLKAMKDYFLLARGEFFQVLIEEGMALMSLPPTIRAEKDINDGPLQSASVKCGLEDDALFQLFRLKLHRIAFQYDFAKLLREPGDAGTSGSTVRERAQVWTASPHVLKQLEEISLVGGSKWQIGSLSLVANCPNQIGACWFSDQMHVDRGFRVQFQFRINSPLAEGFAFVVQNHSHKCIGEGGSGLGYSGLPNSLAVEFDVRHNAELQELNGNHISIHTGWAQPNSSHQRYSIASRTLQSQLADAQTHVAVVEMQGGVLRVYVDDLGEQREVCSIKCDVFRLKPEAGRVWIGFTASTAGSVSTELNSFSSSAHQSAVSIVAWSFSEPGAGTHPGHAWRQLGLECNVESPVNLIFRPDILTRYDSLFRFLFTVKRVQFSLQQCWMVLKNTRYSSWRELPAYRLIFCLRARMQFLIDNLQYYLQVDVLEVQYAVLTKSLSRARDFESVRRAHDVFLGSLTQDCFLLHKQLLRSFEQTFDCCMSMCQLINEHMSKDHWAPEAVQALIQIDQDFKMQSQFIYVILTTATTSVASPHIGQLLLRLDFNQYFSAATRQ